MARYFSCIVPYAESAKGQPPTIWHPTERTGPFATLSRGAYKTELAAIAWAQEHLGGYPYSIHSYDNGEAPEYRAPITGDTTLATLQEMIVATCEDGSRKLGRPRLATHAGGFSVASDDGPNVVAPSIAEAFEAWFAKVWEPAQ